MKDSELDLGILPDKTSKSDCCVPCNPCGGDSDKPRYPELTFRGKHADLFKEKYGPCATDEEYEMTVRLKIKAFGDGPDDYDKRIEFSVLSIIGDVVEEAASDKEDSTETDEKPAMRKLAKAKSAKPAEEKY